MTQHNNGEVLVVSFVFSAKPTSTHNHWRTTSFCDGGAIASEEKIGVSTVYPQGNLGSMCLE